ncbi:MFS transporter [Plantactinospora sp. B5E13]|uniref:MFS transporter n=1 Tax=Plantactinospora sp. B5E13 TaxID=3153758 RepID=UPI00325D767C
MTRHRSGNHGQIDGSGMRDIPRVVWTLAAGRFVNAAGSFVAFYLFLYLTGPRGLPVGPAGLISGALGAGLLAGNLTGGWFGDRFGHRRTLLVASAVAGLGTLAVPWLPAVVLAVVMPVVGYAHATSGVAQGALVAMAVPPGDRRRSVAVTRAAFNAGCVVGPPAGALLVTYSFTWLFVIDGVLTLLVRAATARLLPADPAPTAGAGTGVRALWRAVRADRGLLALLPAVVVVDVVYRQLYSTLPVHLRDHGQPVGLYAALIALGSAMILCLEIPVATVLRRHSALGIIGAGYVLVGLGFGLFSLGTAAWLAVSAMVVLTCGEILYKTTATAHVLDAAPPALVGQYQGLYLGAATSGTILAPPLGALVYSVAPGLLWPLCAIAAVTAGLLVRSIGQRNRAPGRARPAAQHNRFPERDGAAAQNLSADRDGPADRGPADPTAGPVPGAGPGPRSTVRATRD